MSNGYNISSDGTCNFSKVGDRNNTDPMVGPLQNNGGPTDSGTLLPGSPAIDAGNPSGCRDSQGNLLTTDQRGYPRLTVVVVETEIVHGFEQEVDAVVGNDPLVV